MQYRCPSPAKINWFLHITSQRDDGYHHLQTLFQFVDLCDWLTFSLTSDKQIHLSGDLAGVSPKDNLIYRAALALQSRYEVKQGVEIAIEKVIPTGAGLGGGSSNAATTLLMLNQLWQLNLSLEILADIGLSLGADVPIFVHGYSAFADGVGENLVKADIDCPPLLLAMPQNCHISTASIFTAAELKRDSAIIDINEYKFENTHNDCEPIAKIHYNAVANTLRWLLEYAPSRMTGTGACCFAVFNSIEQAQELALIAPNDINCFVVNTHNQSSCHRYIAKHF